MALEVIQTFNTPVWFLMGIDVTIADVAWVAGTPEPNTQTISSDAGPA